MNTLVTSALVVLLAADPPSFSPHKPIAPRPEPGVDWRAPDPARPLETAPSLTGWNINVVDAVETGYSGATEIIDNIAYVGYSSMLVALDITDPSSPVKVGFTLLEGFCDRIVRHGNFLFCMGGDYPVHYLQLVDISTPGRPKPAETPQGSYPIPVNGYAIAVDDTRLYAEDVNGVRVYDITDPTQPEFRGFCASEYITDIVARDGLAYVSRFIGSVKGIQIIDATNPVIPVTVSELTVTTDIGPGRLELVGDYLYALSYFESLLYIIDVSDPTAPTLATTISDGTLYDIEVSEPYAYITDYDAAYVRVYDVTDPSNPVALPPLSTPCNSYDVGSLEVGGTKAAVEVSGYRICFLDLSTPGAPIDVGSYESVASSQTVDVAGDHVALSGTYGLLSMVNRYDPRHRSIAWGEGGYIDGSYVVVKDGYAYMAMSDSWYGETDALEIYDVTDPSNARFVGHLDTEWFPGPVSVGANTAYLAVYSGLWVVDVTNRSLPQKVGELNLNPRDLFAQEPFLYATTEEGLNVLDVSNPALPVVITTVPMSAGALWVSDSHAYVTNNNGLSILDVSNPLQPTLVGQFASNGVRNVRVRDQFAYLTEAWFVRILDVSNPSQPVEVGNIRTPALWARVAVAPPYVYALSDYGPLLILETPLMTGTSRTLEHRLVLEQNYPNPFNPSTTIGFQLETESVARIEVFDVRGRLVRELLNRSLPAGVHSIGWDARDRSGNLVGSGIYFYRLTANGHSEAKKMVLLK